LKNNSGGIVAVCCAKCSRYLGFKEEIINTTEIKEVVDGSSKVRTVTKTESFKRETLLQHCKRCYERDTLSILQRCLDFFRNNPNIVSIIFFTVLELISKLFN